MTLIERNHMIEEIAPATSNRSLDVGHRRLPVADALAGTAEIAMRPVEFVASLRTCI